MELPEQAFGHRLRQEGRGHGSDTSLRQEGGGPCDEVREAYNLRSEVHFDISEPGAIEGGSSDGGIKDVRVSRVDGAAAPIHR